MARRTRQTEREVEIVDEPIEVIEEESGPGLGIDIGICALTTLTLALAIVFLMTTLGEHYAKGPFGG